MNAEATLNMAQKAFDDDRELNQHEFDAIRGAINAENCPIAIRGALQALGDGLRRQSDARLARFRAEQEAERGRQRQRQLDEREQSWKALDRIEAGLYLAMAELPGNAVLRILAKHLLASERGPAPGTFMPEVAPDWQRVNGFPG